MREIAARAAASFAGAAAPSSVGSTRADHSKIPAPCPSAPFGCRPIPSTNTPQELSVAPSAAELACSVQVPLQVLPAAEGNDMRAPAAVPTGSTADSIA